MFNQVVKIYEFLIENIAKNEEQANIDRSNKMSEILEIAMIVSFGASWPMNVIKSYKARTAKGKSIAFLYLIFFGYIAGIASKFVNGEYMSHIGQKWYVLFFYFLNLIMVVADLLLYYRNKKIDEMMQ